MITCTRRIQFCAGHRVVGHENKCANVHGHNYVVLVTAEAPGPGLDRIGRVIDFSVLKEKIGGWIDAYWDHTFISSPDESLELIRSINVVGNKLPYQMPTNPTAENMATHLLLDICPRILEGTGIRITKVRVWETENCYADAELA